MKKIILVTASFEEISLITATKDKKEGLKTTDESHYPLGLAYLHSTLENNGHQVHTLFLNNKTFKECESTLLNKIMEIQPDIIGFQIITPNRTSSFSLIEKIHSFYPEIIIVCGGIHVTVLYEQILNKYPYVIAVLGEGEITLSELVEKLPCSDNNLALIDGLAYIAGGKIRINSPRALIADLDQLPLPKHEIFFTATRECGCIMTARGCPCACSFCSLDRLSLRKVRFRSIPNVMAEIDFMVEKFPSMRKIWIHDDTFFINNKRVVQICDEIIKRNYNLEFICSGRVKPISMEMVNKLKQAKFTKIMFGLESGDNGILKRCHKNITQDDVVNAITMFKNSKIDVKVFLIVGLPGENDETIRETIRFVKQLQKICYINIEGAALLTIYPGTEVFEIGKQKNFINDDYWLHDNATPVFTVENSLEVLFAYQKLILDNLSLSRLLTRNGFKYQYKMLPLIIKYIVNDAPKARIPLAQMFEPVLPGWLYNFARKCARLIR